MAVNWDTFLHNHKIKKKRHPPPSGFLVLLSQELTKWECGVFARRTPGRMLN